MISAPPRLSRVLLATALASALCVPAFAAPAVSGEVFIKLPAGASASGHGGQIEVESFSWGAADAAGPMKPVFVKSWSTSGDADDGPVEGPGGRDIDTLRTSSVKPKSQDLGGWSKAEGLDVNTAPATSRSGATFKGEITTIEPAYRGSGGSKARGGTDTVDRNEKITIHGARTESAGTKGGGKASSDMVMKGSKIGQNSTAGGDTDRPVVIGRLPNPPAEPMQYNPKEYSVSKSNNWAAARHATPLAKGSVWIRVSQPWNACRVGTRYPTLELGGGGKTYVLQDVTVANCGAEEVAFYYNKIVFNAANSMSRPAE